MVSESVVSAQVFSPGKLSRAHARIENDCERCHEGTRSAANKCLSCHKTLQSQLTAKHGYHARIDVSHCGQCHLEHRGADAELIRWPNGDMQQFPHDKTGYPLRGKHRSLPCRECHKPEYQQASLVAALSQGERQRTFLGLTRQCVSCHTDVHRGSAGKLCETCHGEQNFKTDLHFEQHNQTSFPLEASHRNVPCVSCHKLGGALQFEGVNGADCGSCHPTPHRRTMLHKEGTSMVKCLSCHVANGWQRSVFNLQAHPSTVPLQGAHARIPCRSCHGQQANQTPKGTTCISCHQDPHQNKFGNRCQNCHSVASWQSGRKSPQLGSASVDTIKLAASIGIEAKQVQAVAFHDRTRFPLTGKHLVTPCEGCHERKRRGKLELKVKAFSACSDCHADPHRKHFSGKHSTVGKEAHRCESCHETRGFQLTTFDVTQHDGTRFPLRFAHRAVPCAACHATTRPEEKRFQYRDLSCKSCHQDVHRGRYRSTLTGDPLPCATCHNERSFTEISFDHQKTSFALTGAHQNVACLSCHHVDEKRGIVAFQAASTRCADCHRDPHFGQFRSKGNTHVATTSRDCVACHQTTSFKVRTFDHSALTRFPLRGKHLQIPCQQCHFQVTLANHQSTTLYRLDETQCKSCHALQHVVRSSDQRSIYLAAASSTKLDQCAACHVEQAWNVIHTPSTFDHAAVGFSLEGRHQTVACARCHTSSREITRACQTCHEDPHRGQLGNTCAECHRATNWQVPSILQDHRQTRFPLIGKHAMADCTSCHPQARERNFRGTPVACAACHLAEYQDPETHPNHALAKFPQTCEQCHRSTSWRPALFATTSSALIAHRTFPLMAAHASVPCASCHGAEHTRTISSACSSCHLQAAKSAKTFSHHGVGTLRCDTCHTQLSWHTLNFSDSAHRKFPLLGPHRDLSCQECHSSGNLRRSTCTGACHTPNTVIAQHKTVRNMSMTNAACVRCHPLGKR